MNLKDAKVGDSVVVVQVDGHDKERQHLLDMGLIPDTVVKVVKRAPMGDPTEIRLHGYELAIRNSHAEKVQVNQVDSKREAAKESCRDYQNVSSKAQPLSPDELYNLSKIHNCDSCKKNCKHNPNLTNDEKASEAIKAKTHDELLDETLHPGFGEGAPYRNKEAKPIIPPDKTLHFALAGNQNCGKTTLFNVLTGSKQHVGNFPGVTVDKKTGNIKNVPNTEITDLPGVYSLSPYSSEEIIARNFILNEDVDCVINIVDATSIERSLYLSMQLMELDVPVVLALNMMDEVTENGGTILINELEKNLGVPVVPISAIKKQGIDELVDHAIHIARYQELPLKQDFCASDDREGAVHRALHAIMHSIEDHCKKEHLPVRFTADKVAEGDHLVLNSLHLNKNEEEAIEHILCQMEEESGLDRAAAIADMRYKFILRNTSQCVIHGNKSVARDRSEKADKFLTGKYTAIPAFIVIMAIVFFFTFNVIGGPLQILLLSGIDDLCQMCDTAMQDANVNEVFRSLAINGVFAGVGTIISFLPIIIVMFFFLSLLEDSGYMARVAFVMDRLLRKIGLSGRSIVPMLIGFGCSVPAIMATRTLPSERDRKLTILLIPYMSCSAKLPVYAFFCAVVFPGHGGIVMLSLYVLGIIVGILIALFMKGKGKPVPFIMELPNYRLPSVRNVGHLLWDKCKDFLQRAFTVIFVATIIIWFLQSFDFAFNMVADPQNSMLAQVGGAIAPIFEPMGFGDWRIVTALISGFMAKESVVATMIVLFGSSAAIAAAIPPLCAIAILVFCLLYTPCVAAIASIRRELGTWHALAVVFFQCLVAWVVSFVIFFLGSFIVGLL